MKKLAKKLMNSSSRSWVILDTETTGLGITAEAVQIGILAPDGTVLLDTLVKPVNPIPRDATAIHGITNEMVAEAPTFLELFLQVKNHLIYKTVVIYNAPYDKRILEQSLAAHVIDHAVDYREYVGDYGFDVLDWVDIMQPYAEYWGDWSEWHQSYTWQKLTNACRQQGIKVNGAHSAIGDCQMTLALIQKIAGVI